MLFNKEHLLVEVLRKYLVTLMRDESPRPIKNMIKIESKNHLQQLNSFIWLKVFPSRSLEVNLGQNSVAINPKYDFSNITSLGKFRVLTPFFCW